MPVKVSICIPAYKQTEFLRKLLDSILIQTYKDFEVVISDDSPDDQVKEVIQIYSGKFTIKYNRNSPALGSPANWNKAVDLASGEYIKIMHHDDWFTSESSLERFVNGIQSCKHGFVFSQAISSNKKQNIDKLHTASDTFITALHANPELVFLGNQIGPPSSVFFKRSDFQLFDTKLKWLVDIDFYIRMIKLGNGFCFIKEPLITSVNNADHNVTNDCNNPETEVYEYFYLFNKLSLDSRNNDNFQKILLNTLLRYNIGSLAEYEKYARDLKNNNDTLSIIRRAKWQLKFKKIKSFFNAD
jgi:glycosyltransferase involved in cell wall biosynthesis